MRHDFWLQQLIAMALKASKRDLLFKDFLNVRRKFDEYPDLTLPEKWQAFLAAHRCNTRWANGAKTLAQKKRR